MINGINDIYSCGRLPVCSKVKVQYPVKSSMKGDTIEISSKKDSEDIFFNSSMNTEERDMFSKKFFDKIKVLPLIMDRTLNNIGKYISGNRDVKTFSSDMADNSDALLKRAEFGKNAEEYSQSYAPELSLVKNLYTVCNKYNSNTASKDEVDSAVEKNVTYYINDNTVRTKKFIV